MRSKMFGFAAACTFTALSGCSEVDEITVNLDPSFTPAEVEMVTDAARKWETAAPDLIRLKVQIAFPTYDCDTIDVMKREPPPGNEAWTDYTDSTFCHRAEVRSLSPRQRAWTHEFGHALGVHYHNPAGVMAAPPDTDDLTPSDEDSLRRARD